MFFNPAYTVLYASDWNVSTAAIIDLRKKTTNPTNKENAVISNILKKRKFFLVVSIFS
ncbi:MAG: hypothetical protein ACI902_003279 [Psychroserpens sp.]|jgi:hypothetical protein